MWIDDSNHAVEVTESGIMPDTQLDAGWRIGRNITNLGNLCSFYIEFSLLALHPAAFSTTKTPRWK
jgi:hypothetical protein